MGIYFDKFGVPGMSIVISTVFFLVLCLDFGPINSLIIEVIFCNFPFESEPVIRHSCNELEVYV